MTPPVVDDRLGDNRTILVLNPIGHDLNARVIYRDRGKDDVDSGKRNINCNAIFVVKTSRKMFALVQIEHSIPCLVVTLFFTPTLRMAQTVAIPFQTLGFSKFYHQTNVALPVYSGS